MQESDTNNGNGDDLHRRYAGCRHPYSLKLVNQSAQAWTFYVYQQMPDQRADVFSLAWFASPYEITVGNHITFTWSIDYSFVWSNTGVLAAGVVFDAGGPVNADPVGANTTTFSLTPGPNLSDPVKGLPAGSLVINDASDVPNDQFSVGIGMSGTGTHAVQAGTNLKHTFTPTPTYWVAAGTNIQIGSVLDIQTITQTAKAQFPSAVYKLVCVLGTDNQWTIGPG